MKSENFTLNIESHENDRQKFTSKQKSYHSVKRYILIKVPNTYI